MQDYTGFAITSASTFGAFILEELRHVSFYSCLYWYRLHFSVVLSEIRDVEKLSQSCSILNFQNFF